MNLGSSPVRGGVLSGSEQRMLAIGRALMGRPDLICTDKPTMAVLPMNGQNDNKESCCDDERGEEPFGLQLSWITGDCTLDTRFQYRIITI